MLLQAALPEPNFNDLDNELKLLERCRHAHLLPLLGYCRSLEVSCIAFSRLM